MGECKCCSNQDARWTCDSSRGGHSFYAEEQNRVEGCVISVYRGVALHIFNAGPLETQVGKGAVSLNLTLRRSVLICLWTAGL